MPDKPNTLELGYHPPFDWETLLSWFSAHQLADLERVDETGYERIFRYDSQKLGLFRVTHSGRRGRSLRLCVSHAPDRVVGLIAQSVCRMFDLDAVPSRIAKVMKADPLLCKLWKLYPGLRIARSWDRFETLITTILGQLVSVSFARTLTRELMESAGTKAQHPTTGQPLFLFPTPKQLLSCDLAKVRTSEMRRTAITTIASLVISKALPLTGMILPQDLRRALHAAPGLGPWSAEYIAMRGFADDDAFPATDYVLKQELKRHAEININDVRPFRAYAAAALWKNFAMAKGFKDESVL